MQQGAAALSASRRAIWDSVWFERNCNNRFDVHGQMAKPAFSCADSVVAIEHASLIDAERLATNLLSSMPLTFNLLAPWGHALECAAGYLIELLPAFTGAARQLLFEHSSGRGNPKHTSDNTAFDALIRYTNGHGRNGFVAFEIKYSESLREPMPGLKPRHDELSDASGLFADPAAAALRTNPL
jgi:hypothetical protein